MTDRPPADAGSMSNLCAIARALGIAYGDDAPPSEGFLQSNGLRMHWLDWGGADRPTVLFLHGAALTAHTWDLVCLALRGQYRCVALDQRGHGLTDGAHAFGVEEPRADLRGAIQALGLRRFAIVGMSMGGNNAIAYAGAHPEGLAGVVFVDVCPTVLPTGYQDSVEHDAAIACARTFEGAVEAAHRHNPRGSREYKRYTLSFSLEKFADGCWHMRYERERPPPRSEAETAAWMAQRRATLWSLVPRIACPALVVHGGDSRAQSRENLEEFRRRLPDARLVQVPGASHDVQEDQPAALTAELRAFLGALAF
ncbi:MAG: alpha/beta fold hydrolase [Gammaproteobacteria bacterium]